MRLDAEVVGARDEVQAAGGGQVEDLGPCRQLETYKSCSYEKWRAERAARAARWVAEHKLAKAEEKELLDFIAKWGAKAAKATQAKDREKKLERLRAKMRPPPQS